MFKLNQSNNGFVNSANVCVPGCGNNHIRNGPCIAVEIQDGKVMLIVFGDINTNKPTHEIDLSGALEKNREAA